MSTGLNTNPQIRNNRHQHLILLFYGPRLLEHSPILNPKHLESLLLQSHLLQQSGIDSPEHPSLLLAVIRSSPLPQRPDLLLLALQPALEFLHILPILVPCSLELVDEAGDLLIELAALGLEKGGAELVELPPQGEVFGLQQGVVGLQGGDALGKAADLL